MRVGLTGGMGCGKSFVLSCFASKGWKTVETDAVTRQLLNEDREVHEGLVQIFGNGIFGSDGKPDRAAIAGKVFADSSLLRALEELLHPRVRQAWTKAGEGEKRHVIVEIPLLFEKNLEKLFNLNVCVSASLVTQLERLAHRGFGKNEALARMEKQLPLREKELRADYVISNDGDKEFVMAQVTGLIEKVEQLQAGKLAL